MQGRLMGKRIQGEFFDMETDPVPGYDMANWEKGYGDFGIAPEQRVFSQVVTDYERRRMFERG
jgi:hypothetical protein